MGNRTNLSTRVNQLLERRFGLRVSRVGPPAPPSAAVAPPVAPAPKPKPVPEAVPAPPPIPVRGPARAADRLVPEPTFIISPVRSGSTLLRMMLNSHKEICAPHETHFRRLAVQLTTDPVRQAMEAFDLNQRDLEHLLWDRVLHRELTASGKRVLVEKTPSNAFVVDRLRIAWPGARFVFLLRHPASIARSWHEADPENRPVDLAVRHTRNFMEYVEKARTEHPGLTLRYEDLIGDPERETRRVCEFVGVDWTEDLLRYGDSHHGDYVKGLGDWRDKIRSGRIQQGRSLPDPDDVPEPLREYCDAWGYGALEGIAQL